MKYLVSILFIFSLISCKKYCNEPIYNDFNGMYPNINSSFLNVLIESASNTGLKENIKMRKSKGTTTFSKSGCKAQDVDYTYLKFESTLYDFDFEINLSPGTEYNIFNYEQKFNNKDSIKSVQFYLALDSTKKIKVNYSYSSSYLEENKISNNITFRILDSLTTQYGTSYKVFHITNNDLEGVKNQHCISDFFIHQKEGLIRFISLDKSIWDLKKI
jgi:hypothetical protein